MQMSQQTVSEIKVRVWALGSTSDEIGPRGVLVHERAQLRHKFGVVALWEPAFDVEVDAIQNCTVIVSYEPDIKIYFRNYA